MDNSLANTSSTHNPLQALRRGLQYNPPISENYGRSSTRISDGSKTVGYCFSVEPVESQYMDLELDRVCSMSYFYHVPIILCTVFFNVFQNTVALFFLQKELGLPNGFTYFLVGLCAIATTMQALLARAFKIIETPIALTLAQETFLSTLKKTLEASKQNLHGSRVELLTELSSHQHFSGVVYVSIVNNTIAYEVLGPDNTTVIKKNITAEQLGKEFPSDNEQLLSLKREIYAIVLKRQHIQNDLVVSISFQEYQDMSKPFFTTLFTSENKKNFDYALQIMSQHYHTHLHLLSIEKEDYDNVDFTQLPIQNNYNLLAYTYKSTFTSNDQEQNNVATHFVPTIYAPPISLKRYISDDKYRKSTSCCTLMVNTLSALPSTIFLALLPFMGATLQGISSLNDVLEQCGQSNIHGYARLVPILLGIVIGASKATMTYVTKVPPSKQRTQQISLFLYENFNTTQFLKWCYSSDRNVLEDFCKVLSFDCSLSALKRLLIITFYAIPALIKFFGYFAATGTIFFYAGLGLFFSNSGLYELDAFSNNPAGHTPSHDSTDYSNIAITVISFLLCIAIAILNGFFNQGWEAVKLFTRYAKEIQSHLHKSIELTIVTSTLNLLEMPAVIPNTNKQNTVLFLTIVDSCGASATAYYGSTKIMSALSAFFPLLKTHHLSATLNILIAFSIFISQTCFSFELYKRDEKVGGNLWGKLFAVHLPECSKRMLGIQDAVTFPHTQGAMAYPRKVASRLRSSPSSLFLEQPKSTSDTSLSSTRSPFQGIMYTV